MYFEFGVEFDQSMYEGLCEPSGVVAVCFSDPFMRVMKPVEAGRSFMYDCEYNEERHVTGVYLSGISVKDAIEYRSGVKRRVEDSVVIHWCRDLLTK